MLDEVVSKADFARRVGVTKGRVSQWLHDGYIGQAALVGTGLRARIKVDVALEMLRGCLDTSRLGSRANLDRRKPSRGQSGGRTRPLTVGSANQEGGRRGISEAFDELVDALAGMINAAEANED